MATLAEFRAQYPQYDSVPDIALADSLHEKFYSKIPKVEFYKTIGLGTAAAIPGAENVVTGKTAPEVSMRDRIMGVIETPAVVAGGLASGVVAPLAAMYGELTSPAPQGSAQATAAGEAMAKKAREQFYQPRTQTSREILGAVGEFLQPVTSALPPTLGSTGATLNALAPTTAMQVNALARPVIAQAVAPVKNAVVNAMTREQPAMVGMGAASTAEDLMRQERLNRLGIPATAGERTKNLAQQQFESEVQRGVVAGIGEEAKTKLAEQMAGFKANQKKAIVQNFERMTNEVGAEVADPTQMRAVGKIVDKALNDQYTKKFDEYKALYAKADQAGETLQQVPYQGLLDYINT
jgi:hypothetical protein